MENFVSVIINKDKINEHRDIVLDSIITTGNVGLLETEIEYEIYESENNTQVISVPLSKKLSEKQQEMFAKKLANKLFDKGHTEFDIEFGLTEDETIARTLRSGMRGEDVRRIQREIGMPAADQDGIFGPKTERAIRNFQQNAGIQVDGIVGQQTQSAILKYRMPGTGIAVQQPGPAYIDAPYPKTQPPTGPSRLRQRQQQQQQQQQKTSPTPKLRPQPKVVTPPERPVGQLPRDQRSGVGVYGQGANDPRNVGYDSGYRQSDRPSMFATDVPDKEATGVWKVVPDGKGTFNLVGPDGVVNRSVGQNGRFSQTKVPEMEKYAQRLNKEQGLTGANTTSDEQPDAMTTAPGMGQNDTTSSVRPKLRPGGTDPEVNTNVPSRLSAPDGPQDDTSAFAAAVQPAEPGGSGKVLSNNIPPVVYQAAEKLAGDLTPDNVENLQGHIDSADMPPILKQTTLQYLDQMYPEDVLTDPETLAGASDEEKAAAQSLTDLKVSLGASAETGANIDTTPANVDTTSGNAMAAAQQGTAAFTNTTSEPITYNVVKVPGPAGSIKEFRVKDSQGNIVKTFKVNSRRDIRTKRKMAQDHMKSLQSSANENVTPKPKGAFMFRERKEWDAKYGKTHNNDGSVKTRNFISESKMQEVTFHDDDEFFEAYGVLWFNEDEMVDEAEYQGRKVKLGKPMAGDVKKFKVYVKNPKGNVVKVNFGQKGAKIKKNNPERRRSFRARHNCDNPGPRHKARYWSCRKW